VTPDRIILVLLFVLLVVITAYALVLRARASIAWEHPIPGYYPDTAFLAPERFNPAHLARALMFAETCIIKHTRWNAGQVAAAALRAHVIVEQSVATCLTGRRRATLDAGHVMVVDAALSSVCHELVHLCEAVLEGRADETHVSWVEEDMHVALDEYERWVLKQDWRAT